MTETSLDLFRNTLKTIRNCQLSAFAALCDFALYPMYLIIIIIIIIIIIRVLTSVTFGASFDIFVLSCKNMTKQEIRSVERGYLSYC